MQLLISHWSNVVVLCILLSILMAVHTTYVRELFGVTAAGYAPAIQQNAYDATMMLWGGAIMFVTTFPLEVNKSVSLLMVIMLTYVNAFVLIRVYRLRAKGRNALRLTTYTVMFVLWGFVYGKASVIAYTYPPIFSL